MKQFLLFAFSILTTLVFAQPAQFEMPCGTTASNQLNRFVTVNGLTAESGADWAAVIDSDGFTVARGEVFDLANFNGCATAPAFSMEVYGNDNLGICDLSYGLNFGEDFQVVIWDASSGVFYTISETLTYQGGFSNYPAPAGGTSCTTVDAADASVFPVTFTNLSARDLSGKVAINWSTASESGNEYFEVEHSNRLGGFTAIGRVEGAGDSQELLDYDFVHGTPVAGTNYYRIKQVDFEGTFTYSGIIPVDVSAVQADKVTLFPNPAATGYFNLNVGSGWNVGEVSVTVTNVVGRRVMDWTQDVTATRQIITSDLAAGMYLVRVEGGKRTSTKRLIVK